AQPTLRPTPQQVKGVRPRVAGALWVSQNVLHPPPERLIHDARASPLDQNVLVGGLDHQLLLALPIRAPDGYPLLPPVDQPPHVGLVGRDRPNGERIPASAIERRDAARVQLMGNSGETAGLSVALKDALHRGALHQVDLAPARSGIIEVAVAALASPLRHAASVRPLGLAARGAFENLLPLHLGAKGAGSQDEPADGRVLKLFGDDL